MSTASAFGHRRKDAQMHQVTICLQALAKDVIGLEPQILAKPYGIERLI